MKRPTAILVIALTLPAAAFAAAPKPPAKPAAKPVVTMKDLAVAEAKKCDVNHNGKIDGTEYFLIRSALKQPTSHLYFYDDNSNHFLDDAEIAAITFAAAPPPKPAAPAPKKKGH